MKLNHVNYCSLEPGGMAMHATQSIIVLRQEMREALANYLRLTGDLEILESATIQVVGEMRRTCDAPRIAAHLGRSTRWVYIYARKQDQPSRLEHLINHLQTQPGRRGLAEFARLTGQTRADVHRWACQLVEAGILSRDFQPVERETPRELTDG
jgi:DNA-binding IclR family transcriptional regulator